MRDVTQASNITYKALSRLAVYTVFFAWILLGLYILSITRTGSFTAELFKYFLSTEESGIKFRALTLLAPFALTVIAYLINERSRLFQETVLAEREVRSELVIAFANAIDAKSPWTMGHSERVASYALALAKEMRVNEHDLAMLKVGSLLHDIGKIGTYDVILEKVDPLTEEEWKLIKMHPAKGAAILKPIEQLQEVIPIIRHHHERIDGKGYPDGLKDEEIPLLAKILCLADSFDAMTADRPYKRAMSKNDAISHIRLNAGTQFDPKVVEVFLRTLDKS